MALFNNLVLPLWICYWLRFQESYENVISSLTTSRATCPAPSGNVIISRSSSTLSLTSQITILILSVVLLFLLPPSRTLHTAALWSSVWLQKGAVKKKKRGKKNNPRQTNKSREEARELHLILLYYGFHGQSTVPFQPWDLRIALFVHCQTRVYNQT